MFFWSPPGGVLSFSKAKKKEPKKNALGGHPRPKFHRQESDPLGAASHSGPSAHFSRGNLILT
jgi:hypothetical protein